MSNELKTLTIDGTECYEKDGVAYLRLKTVARGLGFTPTQIKNGKEYASLTLPMPKGRGFSVR